MNKTTLIYIKIVFLLPLFAVLSCTDEYREEFLANDPIYMSYDDLRSAVRFDTSRDIFKPGRIYFKGDTLFIVENYAGVHVLRVDNPAKPERVGFITIPGCTDLSVRNYILYANSYVDLVAINISDLSNIKESARHKDAFQYSIPETETNHPISGIDQAKGVVINWEVRKINRELDVIFPHHYYPTYDKNELHDYSSNSSGSSGGDGVSIGVGGSMATFGLYDRYLYIMDSYSQQITVYDVNNASAIDKINSISTRAQAETMFIYDKHMFLGTTSGVNVFDLKTPSTPQLIASHSHITACDPVVIQDGYAYYTLRGGNQCGSRVNRLDIIKFSDNYQRNELVSTFAMTEPYGLGIDKNTLFVCDGPAGLKIYDATDKERVSENKLAEFPNIFAYDVIPMKGYLFSIGKSGFNLYDYTNIKDIKEIASIPVIGLCNVIE